MSQNQGTGWNTPPQAPPPANQGQGGWASPPPNQGGYPSKYCQACGAVVDARAEICPNCGVRQAGFPTGYGKSRPLAIVLALLLGNFGVHRFYLGNVAWGIAYLIFFWTGIPGLIAWVEALYFLTRSNQDWAQEYGGPVDSPNGCAMGCLWVLALLPLLAIASVFSLILVGGQIETILSEIANEI